MAEGRHTKWIREGVDAYNRGDDDALLALLSDDVEWKRVDGLPDEGGGVIRGREAVRALLQPEVFANARIEPLEFAEGDDVVLMHGIFRATGAASGIGLEVETFAVYWIGEDGLARRVENWQHRDDAERSSGLRLS